MRCLAFIALLLLPGCDKLFGLQHFDLHDASGDGDGPPGPVDATADAPLDVGMRVVDGFVDIGCPASYTVFGTASQYRFVSTPVSWTTAEADCANDTPAGNSKRTHLSVMSIDTERSEVYNGASGSAGTQWIGLTDRKQSTVFKWVTNQVTNGYPPAPGNAGSPWDVGQPSNGVGEDCVVMLNSTAAFDDRDCNSFLPYVCECDAYSPNNNNF